MEIEEAKEPSKKTGDHKLLYEDFLEVHYSFGWQCWLSTNICILDEKNVCFGAGTFIVIMEIPSGKQIILPTICYTGVAHIIAHPNCSMFAVAEKGNKATIDIYTYPDLKLSKLLKGGTECSYVCIDFNPDGNLLAALSSKPDFVLTVWQWEKEIIILKSKAFSVDVWKVAFSKFVQGKLITGGSGHIKFWSMARTFTGLKLKGEIGKFGHTDICDIHSFVQLPDGKVISSSQWGNMLLWDGNKMRTQISGNGGVPCHEGIIHHICMEEGELLTVGSDGWVKVWDAESIEMIYSEDEQGVYALKPLGEVKIQNADLRCLTHSPNQKGKKMWYAQDANGIIWKVDMSLDFGARPPEAMHMFPGIKVTGCEISPSSHILAISSKDATVRLYNCLNNSLIISHQYKSPITSLLWGPRLLDRNGASILLGFENGIIRWIIIKNVGINIKRYELLLHKAIKPHDSDVTCMKFDNFVTRLVSCGLDGKVFFHSIQRGDIVPVGFVDIGHPIEWTLWLLKVDLLLIGSSDSFIAAIEAIKTLPIKKDATTYKLADVLCKTVILRNEITYFTAETIEVEDFVIENIALDENKSKSEQKDVDHKITAEQSCYNVTCALYTGIDGKFWLCLETDGMGYIYEYELTKGMMSDEIIALDLLRQLKLPSVSHPQHITCMHFTPNNYYLLTGQNDGILTAYALEENNQDLELTEIWSHRIMDCETGAIKYLCTSFDGKFLATASNDNNALMFKIIAPKYASSDAFPENIIPSSSYWTVLHDIDESILSLESTCKRALEVQRKNNFEKKRQHIINRMALYRTKVDELNEMNLELPSHMQIDLETYAVHEGIKEALEIQLTSAAREMEKRLECELEYNKDLLKKLHIKYKDKILEELHILTSFLCEEKAQSYRMVHFPLEHYRCVDFSELKELKILEFEFQRKRIKSVTTRTSLSECKDLLISAGNTTDENLQQILEKHIGDYKLKTDAEYHPPKYIPMEPKVKRLQMLQLILQTHEKRIKINEDFFEMKSKRDLILSTLEGLTEDNSENIILNKNIRKKLSKLQISRDSHRCDVFDSVCPWHIDTTLSVTPDIPEEDTTALSAPSSRQAWKIFSKFVGLVRRDTYKSAYALASLKNRPWERSVDLSRKLKSIKTIRETYRSNDTNLHILKQLWTFDCQLHLYNLNKRYLDVQIKQADIKSLTFLQEYGIFRKYDMQRNNLTSLSSYRDKQKSHLKTKLRKYLEIINQQNAFVSTLASEEANVSAEFRKLLGDNNKYAKLLTKFFKKKIALKSADVSDTDILEEFEDDDDESDWSSEDDDDFETEWDFKDCPEGCDPELFESVCDLRQKRSHIEHKIKEIKQLKQIQSNELDILEKRHKFIKESLVPIKQQLEGIQLLKQSELNNIYQIVHLNLDQIIHCKLPIPQDLNDCIVFPSREIVSLKERLTTLTKDAGESTKVSKDVRLKQAELKRECRLLTRRVQELRDIAKERMFEKFGRIVNLEELKLVENPVGVKELEKKQKEQYLNHQKALKERKDRLDTFENVYAEVRKERAQYVQILTALKSEWLSLYTSLSKRKVFTFKNKSDGAKQSPD